MSWRSRTYLFQHRRLQRLPRNTDYGAVSRTGRLIISRLGLVESLASGHPSLSAIEAPDWLEEVEGIGETAD